MLIGNRFQSFNSFNRYNCHHQTKYDYFCIKKMTSYSEYIEIKTGKRFGKPCIKGTRISVYDVLAWLASGMSVSEIVKDFPELSRNHILACLSFAAEREQRLRITK